MVSLAWYRDKLFLFLAECFLAYEPLIAAFAGHLFKVYDFKVNVLSDVSPLDCSVKMKSLKLIYDEI